MRKRLRMSLNCQKDQEVASDNQLGTKNRIKPETEKDGQQGTENVQTQVNESLSPLSRLDEINNVHSECRKSRKAAANTDYPESPKGLFIGRIFAKPYEKPYEESTQKINHQGWPGKIGFHEKTNKSPQNRTARSSCRHEKEKLDPHERLNQTWEESHSDSFSLTPSSPPSS